MRTRRSLRSIAALAVTFWVLASAAPAQAELLIGLTNSDQLVKFDSASSGMPGPPISITGLQPGEGLCGIDFRPANGELYAVGSTARLYKINTATGAATQVGTPGTFSLSGSFFGVDFDPVADRLRLVSSSAQNLSINPETGALDAPGAQLSYAMGDANQGQNPVAVGLSHTNNVAGAGSTVPYVIDSSLDILALLSPDAGTLTTRGPLGVQVGANYGSDISGATGRAYGVSGGSSSSILLERNLDSGQATPIGSVPHPLRGLSVLPTAPGGGPAGPPSGQGPGTFFGPFFELSRAMPRQFIPPRGTLSRRSVVFKASCPAPPVADQPPAGPDPTAAADCIVSFFFGFRVGPPSASQRRRSVVTARGRARIEGGGRKQVRLKLTRAGRKTFRRLHKKRVRGRLTAKVRYRQSGRADQRRTFKRDVTLRVRRPRR